MIESIDYTNKTYDGWKVTSRLSYVRSAINFIVITQSSYAGSRRHRGTVHKLLAYHRGLEHRHRLPKETPSLPPRSLNTRRC